MARNDRAYCHRCCWQIRACLLGPKFVFEKLLWAGSIEPATRCLEAMLALALCYRACATDHFVSSYRVLNTSELYPAKRATANLTTKR